MTVRTLRIDGRLATAPEHATILSAAREVGVTIPTLCQLDAVSSVGACRLCLVEVAGSPKLLPACTTPVQEEMVVTTQSPRLEKYRRMIVELLYSERNHVCAICVSNGHCELQERAYDVGMTHVRYEYLNPELSVDASHERFSLDHNRCILCTRCVRVCDEMEGAHTWDLMNRGIRSRVISDLHRPWGESDTCTSCGKCVTACPTGALFDKHAATGQMVKHPQILVQLQHARERSHGHSP